MNTPTTTRARIKAWLLHRYRLLVVDDATYQQTVYFVFTRRRVLGVIGIVIGTMLLINTAIIVFTPVREWIPGYTDPQLKAKQTALNNRMELLERMVASRDSFIQTLKAVSGYVPADSEAIKSKISERKTDNARPDAALAQAPAKPAPQAPQRVLPIAVAQHNLMAWAQVWPLEGLVTRKFSPGENHFAVDLAARENAPVLCIADGVVILAEYSAQTGYVIGVQHAAGLVSFYKHNGALFKKAGAYVQAGEALALVGNSGENSTGPHLHFEVWQNGQPVDPQLFLKHTEN
jgi:murein DD-endopeptidase MepM/ murein hydrolase activator NlpD